ncbi:hypothetical protein GM3708_1980 [Geminocystis sp. NIES-3708]|uniref:hypothetical protein n=1 Tax=Geminocystis sp. NIES-3708 TaxID=1615909 RepID=UPI0005FCAA2A|nr:hypothetical protein [Geminocystis sp. NIES-3708]BAQ61574.1 hypothetical protein GM3708_1980 [Geminocystis sp. NIES-3708]
MNQNNFNTFISQMALSLFTPTVIITKIVESELVVMLEDMGKASEEIFRGERLPILKNHQFNNAKN